MPSISISTPKALPNAYRAIGSPSLSSASSSPSKESFFAPLQPPQLTAKTCKTSLTTLPLNRRTNVASSARPQQTHTSTRLHDSIRSTQRETCPEIVMNRKRRKSIEYKRNRAVDAAEEKKELGATPSPQRRAGVLSPFRRSPAPSELEHSRTGVVTAMRKPAPEQERRSGVPSALRNPNARRSRAGKSQRQLAPLESSSGRIDLAILN
ncbi:hypothetical protein K443DRAFT_4071 [Laccaria amethystina LaAM-08-1]|uniref:Uncharacterized protein n=1 Tax=Laccaria amethystina LaAM-08-1 TaxID=1095629 RepID=A0A0C9YAL5_9AGAR|nr:hypothetical protein K443DRAFT_4071 [Laccaria amethystina LaAM-08-1]